MVGEYFQIYEKLAAGRQPADARGEITHGA
jgi:hypothetical protein